MEGNGIEKDIPAYLYNVCILIFSAADTSERNVKLENN